MMASVCTPCSENLYETVVGIEARARVDRIVWALSTCQPTLLNHDLGGIVQPSVMD